MKIITVCYLDGTYLRTVRLQTLVTEILVHVYLLKNYWADFARFIDLTVTENWTQQGRDPHVIKK